ncbi:hypothetical protein SAMD00019534_093780, partial [Acytostelium subglobosum LB1]|uniref:hypothetical protein n=1 Tax=Acytostelium subglobosum LB1 TaxID=1410327 RepID=UPI000644C86B
VTDRSQVVYIMSESTNSSSSNVTVEPSSSSSLNKQQQIHNNQQNIQQQSQQQGQQQQQTQQSSQVNGTSSSNTTATTTTTTDTNQHQHLSQQQVLQQQQMHLSQASKLLHMQQQGPPQLSPPALFGIIEPQLYRTNSLYPVNFPFIKMLGLKTVVQLSPEVPIKAVTTFLEENNINLIHLGLKAWKADTSWKPVTEELIKETMEIVLNYDFYPLMITCTSGIHQTGVLVGCLRRLQNWNLTSILVEYRSFTGQSNTRYVNEQFIELFDVDLVTLPNNLPRWFVEQQRLLEEEEENDDFDDWRQQSDDANNSNNNSNNNNIS